MYNTVQILDKKNYDKLADHLKLFDNPDNKNSKWWFDPYDKDYKHPFLMNLSEKEEYDELFPDHPLSQCRKFVKYITERL